MWRVQYYRWIIITTCLLFISACLYESRQPSAVQGELDVSGWNFVRDGSIGLNGEWEFYWNQLRTPAYFSSNRLDLETKFIMFPHAWNAYKDRNASLPSQGYATYRLIISTESAELKALRLSKLLSAYRLWVNGELLATSGVVGIDAEAETPELSLKIVEFTPQQNRVEIVLQVSNHNYRDGGVIESILFGAAKQIRSAQNRQWAYSLILLFGLALMGGYHLILYLLRRDDLAPLYLSAYCVCWFINLAVSSSSGWIIRFLMPDLSWHFLYKSGLLSYFVSMPLLVLFLHSLFPAEWAKLSVRRYYFLVGLFCASVVFLPLNIGVTLVPVFHFISLLVAGYLFYILARLALNQHQGLFFTISGLLVLTLSGVNDVLHDLNLISTHYLMTSGVFIFILLQSFAVSARFTRAVVLVEKLSGELKNKKFEKPQKEFSENGCKSNIPDSQAVVSSVVEADADVQTPATLSLIESFNQQRIRLHKLEDELIKDIAPAKDCTPEILNVFHDVDSALIQLNHSLSSQGEHVDLRLAIVEVMRLAINYWREVTKTGKAELALRSSLWKVYTNEDGWERTQTMDRYLGLETLPKYPRRRQVIRTAEYVLTQCTVENDARKDLEYALAQLRNTTL